MADTQLIKRLRMSASLPGDRADNGIDHLADVLVGNPDGSLVLAVAVLSVAKTEYHPDTGESRPTVQIDRIEAVMLDTAPREVRDWMAALTERRGVNDQEQLPDDEALDDHLDEPSSFDDVNEVPVDPDTVAIVPADADTVVTDIFNPKKRR